MRIPVILLSLVMLVGCGRETGQRSYKEVHRPAPAAAAPGPPAPAAVSPSSQPDLTWTTPESWQETAGSGMRLTTFTASGADGSVIILAGGAGGEVENVKRWAGQVDVTMDDSAVITFLSKQKRITSEGGFPVLLVDLTSETGLDAASALAAISMVEGHSVFVKLSGKGSVLAAELENFVAVCASLRLASGSSAPVVAAPATGKIAWALPEGWTEKAGSGMRMATITPAEAGGECSIVSLAGEAGGISANITRWLEQIEVTMSEEKVLAFLETQDVLESQDGHAVMLIDMTGQVKGPDADAMIVGIARFGEQTIFLKLTGTAGYLNGQKASFKALCESLHLDGAAQ